MTVVHLELHTRDMTAACAFYSELLQWQTEQILAADLYRQVFLLDALRPAGDDKPLDDAESEEISRAPRDWHGRDHNRPLMRRVKDDGEFITGAASRSRVRARSAIFAAAWERASSSSFHYTCSPVRSRGWGCSR